MSSHHLPPRPLAAALTLAALAACSQASRVELSPATLRFGVRGQTAKLHAAPLEKSGKPVPDQRCKWSSSDEKVATVAGPANDVTVTAIGPGSAAIRCAIGDVTAEAPVLVRVVSKVVVAPEKVEVKMLDVPAPVALQVTAYDDAGAPVQGRVTLARCAREEICRGDGRAQLWGVAAGDTTAFVEVEGARSGDVAVHVVDARSADAKPKAVKGNPMEEIERAVRKRDAEQAKAAAKAKP